MRGIATVGAALAAGVAATAWTALTLAEFGRFVAIVPILAFPAAAAAVFALLSGGRAPGSHRPRPRRTCSPSASPAPPSFLTIPADELILGGQDPGVYLHIAASVARTGSLILDEPDLAALTGEERQLVSRNHLGFYEPFPGMYLRPDGRISPQFYHLFPSLMAVAWSIGGIRAALLVNPLLNVAAILALYAVASLLLGRRWALAAALLHALAAAQLRQAKFPTAELMTQFFLLAGVALLALATLEEAPPRALAPLAGSMLGMAMLTRYDTILFLVPLAVALLWGMGPARLTRPVVAALGTMALFCVQSWLHQQYVSPFYQPLGGLVGGYLAAAALLVAALLLARRTGAWRRLEAGILKGRRRSGSRRRRCSAAGSCSAGLSAPVSPARAGSVDFFATWSGTRRARGSPSCSPGPSPATCSTSSTSSGRSGFSPRWPGLSPSSSRGGGSGKRPGWRLPSPCWWFSRSVFSTTIS